MMIPRKFVVKGMKYMYMNNNACAKIHQRLTVHNTGNFAIFKYCFQILWHAILNLTFCCFLIVTLKVLLQNMPNNQNGYIIRGETEENMNGGNTTQRLKVVVKAIA